ncbi:MAG: hypothetical protein H7X99_05300 [Saprospiraceae bacterium]|nr:hypothetical protein [Saprospiraceae bacterium]
MKTSFQLLLIMALTSVIALSSFTSNDSKRWEKLGERKVNRGLDHDQIQVGAGDGVYSKLKVIVRNSGINMHRMVVHYGNGEKQEIVIREDIRKGGESRIIDLEGNRRVISKVDFWYDTKGLINDKAVVELWGRH